MIGDGYGFNAMALGNYTLGDLNARRLPVRGYVSTHGVDHVVNDSAATATALATGKRTRAKATGTVVQDGKLVPGVSILAAAESRGIATGLVTSTQLTHATPAAFFGTQEDRGNLPGLANDFLTFKDRSGGDGIDIAIAGGRSSFDAKQREQLEAQGYKVVDTFEPKPTQNTVMLLAPEGLSGARARLRGNSPQPSLAQMTHAAIERLSTDQDGFFLMVEGGQIDWKLHDGAKDETLVAEIQDFDEAVAAARAYVEAHPDTLLIVTADHDHTISVLDNHYPFASGRCGVAKRCGGTETFDELAVKVDGLVHADGFRDPAVRGDWPPAAVLVQYAWIVEEAMKKESLKAPHSAHFVPLFAQGPWSEELRGYSDQPEVGQLLHRWAATLSD
ncbi:MAG: alkaline phosphatase [bacterium]